MKLFTKVKTITAKTGELHFERWAIIETKWLSWYLHRIHKADQDHLHSHPWHFISLILKGSYIERVDKQDNRLHFKVKSPFKLAYTNRKWFHKIDRIVKGPVYTTVWVWGGNFEGDKWHYLVGDRAIPFTEYRDIKTKAKETGQSIELYVKANQLGKPA